MGLQDMLAQPLFLVPTWEVSKLELNWSTKRETRSLNRCIYCGSKVDLTDEHTFPFALWGKRELLRGSCTECQRKIQPVEQYLCRDLLGKVREFLSSPTRQKRKRRSGQVRTGYQPMWDWETGKKFDVPAPLALPMIILPNRNHYPRRMTGEMFQPLHECKNWSMIPLAERTHEDVVNRLSVEFTLKPNLVERVIAKIAYSEFIFQFDSTYYNEELARFILGSDANDFVVSQYVGSSSTEEGLNRLHSIEFFCTPAESGRFNLAAKLVLFHYWKAPTFWVWLGLIDKRVDGIRYSQNPPKGPVTL
jgi:hypothetical protein